MLINQFRDNIPIGWHVKADGTSAILHDFHGRPVCDDTGRLFEDHTSVVVTPPPRWPKTPRWWKNG